MDIMRMKKLGFFALLILLAIATTGCPEREIVETFNVIFNVQDAEGEAIEGATVTLGEEDPKETHPSGAAEFRGLEEGTYSYTVEYEGYQTVEDELVVDENQTVTVDMEVEPDTYTVTFVVEDEDGEPIDDAVVTFDGEELAVGEYEVEEVVAGEYDYSVAKAGFVTVEGSVEVVDEDVTEEVQLVVAPTYTVTFVVEDEDEELIDDAVVTFDGEELAVGEYVVEEVLAGTYDYSVAKAGFDTVEGSVEVVDEDVDVPVTLVEEQLDP